MAEEDDYNNKRHYDEFKENYRTLLQRPTTPIRTGKGKREYFCRNKANIVLFPKLFSHFEVLNLSYNRRNNLISTLCAIVGNTDRELRTIDKEGDRAVIDEVIKVMQEKLSDTSMLHFKKNIITIWKVLFPAIDDKGRIDEMQKPYVVRHIKPKLDRSKKRLPKDRIKPDTLLRLLDSFSDDPRVQFYIAFAYESLGRPQEILGIKIENVQLYDNYATLYAPKGKEGAGLLRCIDSYPYLLKLLARHPLRNDKNAYLFLNTGQNNRFQKMTPPNINKKIRERCKLLGIVEKITCYSFKRNGVTDLRLRGESDKQIQERARWTTTKQIHTYDISDQEEAFKVELVRRGLMKPDGKTQGFAPVTKQCPFCNVLNPAQERSCYQCQRLLYREDIEKEQQEKDREMQQFRKEFENMRLLLLSQIKPDEFEQELKATGRKHVMVDFDVIERNKK